MKKHQITGNYYYVKTRDKVGGTIRSDVYTLEDGMFRAYSTYWQDEDEEFVGVGESDDEQLAIRLSRKDLRKEWLEYKEQKSFSFK